ncbi:endonuclease [Myroides pelagicus]|uniref:Endonuclease n=2 Tax=Myroides pelagicus TaxID=270914 RepID=A0A7K1GQ65_9FLAO|nr:endonuclease [Myroides pelagicus]
MQDGKADTGQNDYFDVNIQAHNWIKITLNLTNVDYNKSKQGSLFALKVGKNGNYDLLISNISFDDKEPDEPTEPTNPTEPSNPGEYTIPNDQKAYYSSIDFAKTSGIALRDALGDLVQKTHKRTLSYTGVWSALKQADLTPDGRNVYLLYGHKGQTSGRQAYTRSVNANGGGGTDWNREHTYAKSLGTPNLGTSGPGADAHHLRPSDTGWNSTRGNKKFAKGNGNSGSVSGGWYPGDEWRGDVARMMMYMYIRYENRCLPTGVTIGSKNKVDAKMVDLLLEWNAADPVSDLEIQRNEYLGNASNNYGQGNRNPFIDNPHLATAIWGGPEAQNRWK